MMAQAQPRTQSRGRFFSTKSWLTRIVGGYLIGALTSACLHADTTITIEPIQWTDRLGTIHQARNTNLDFYDYNGLLGESLFDTFLGQSPTNAAGSASFTTNRDDFGSEIEFYSYIRAAIPGIAHVKANLADPEPYRQLHPVSGTFDIVENSSGTFAGTAANNVSTDNIGTSIGFIQSIGFMGNYYNTTHAAALPFVTVVYNTSIASSAYFEGANPYIELRYGAWGAWDVMMHEYGHHVATVKGFDLSPGGGHSHGVNNIGALQQGAAAQPGARLAWSEGVATHLALMANRDGNLAGYFTNALPAQDTDTNYDSYQSTSSVTNETHLQFRYNVESKTSSIANRIPRGEGDEWAVGLALWDFYDTGAANNENFAGGINRKDRASFGAAKIFQTMDTNNTATFRDLWHAVGASATADPSLVGLTAAAETPQILGALGEILEENTIASKPLTSGNIFDTTPNLVFTEGNDDRSGSYAFVIFDDQFDLVTSNVFLNDLANMGNFNWDVDTELTMGDSYWWAVLNTSALYNTTQPSLATDIDKWYWSGLNPFTVVPEPSGILVAIVLMATAGPWGRRKARHVRNQSCERHF